MMYQDSLYNQMLKEWFLKIKNHMSLFNRLKDLSLFAWVDATTNSTSLEVFETFWFFQEL